MSLSSGIGGVLSCSGIEQPTRRTPSRAFAQRWPKAPVGLPRAHLVQRNSSAPWTSNKRMIAARTITNSCRRTKARARQWQQDMGTPSVVRRGRLRRRSRRRARGAADLQSLFVVEGAGGDPRDRQCVVRPHGYLAPQPAIFPGPADARHPHWRVGAGAGDDAWVMSPPKIALKNRRTGPGVTNIRNLGSAHWRRWLGLEHRCLVGDLADRTL